MPLIEKSSYHAPFLLGNAHIQTILPSYMRHEDDIAYEREPFNTPDDDVIQLDWSKVGSDRLLIINHGLCGHTHRHYVLSLVKAFNANGWDCMAWNYRGTSKEQNKQLKFTTNNSTDELGWLVNHAIDKGHYRKIALSGYSMGGNIATLYLSREAERVPPQVIGGAVFCAAIDLHGCTISLDNPFNRIYTKHFLKKLIALARAKHEQFPDKVDLSNIDGIKTFHDYDNRFTAPLVGFKDADDYYTTASASRYLEKLKLPLLMVNPKNDPFLGGDCYPVEFAKKSDKLFLEIPDSGGHCGFITPGRDKLWWPAQRALDFLTPLAEKP
ncbi:MAG: alpha/beta fold hydrolase [Lentisphaeria bacterium]|nr:alpha/beta fold hydrolase [Victivallales bacterium]MBR6058604.1 alpha/beta fold hydrolase [Victivallales bacterium]MCR4573309.1 alpha/beta fold hydrolase [Lentisphaeria bacterium]